MTEELTFREFFCTTKVVVVKLCYLLLQWQMIPEDGTTNHIIWALFFMRVYLNWPKGSRHLLDSWWFGGCH